MKKVLALLLTLCMVFSMCAALAEEEPAPTYTYDSSMTDFPTNWSPFKQQTNADFNLYNALVSSFYSFEFNDTLDGYKIVPDAATDYPIDVTKDYVGEEWNIQEGETGRAYIIPLRDDLKWQDGTPIVAEDFVRSAELLLSPKAQNLRADGLYSGNLVVANAEAYLKQGLTEPTSFGAIKGHEGLDHDGFMAAHGTEPGYINWNNSFGDTYDFEAKAWTGAAEDAVVDTGLTVAELYAFYTEGEGAAYATWASPEQLVEWTDDELFTPYSMYADGFPFEKVGIKALSDTELLMILTKKLQGFYLYYSIPNWLVNVDLYEKCASESDNVYNNTYGTTLDTTISWGPWVLSDFQSDKEFVLIKNENWYGFADEKNAGLYQTTARRVQCVKDVSTRYEMFLNGELDTFGLDRDYIKEYASSEYTYYDEGDSVFAMVFNPNLEALKTNEKAVGENINKTILTVKEFRMAMSLAMNRAEFCLAVDPTNAPAFALYGGQIVADPEEGVFYRTTDVAKQVVVNFWGLADEIGEGKMYADADEAIESITGYNLEMAREYFNIAYDKAVEQGLMDGDDVVQIMIGTPNATSAFYNAGYDFIVNNYTEAVKGTKLEGKLTFERDATLGNGFADALRNNNVDMLFGVGWTGSTFDPYGLMEAYLAESYQYDPAWNPSQTMLTIAVDGVEYTTDCRTWQQATTGEKIIAKANGEDAELDVSENAKAKIEILGELENAVLQNYDFIPLMGDSSASLKGMQVEYFIEDEVFPLSRGGFKYMTYNYSDAEWEAFVKEQGGTLNYK